MKTSFSLVLTLFFFSIPRLLSAAEEDTQAKLSRAIPEFERVDEKLWRGSQPTEETLGLLKDAGVKTIVNFRDEPQRVERERAWAQALGLEYINLPWRMQRQPKAGLMREFLDLIAQENKAPFFMHCKRGVERTGVADSLYRYYFKKLPRDKAYDEAMNGHHRLFYWRPFTLYRYNRFIRELDSAPSAS